MIGGSHVTFMADEALEHAEFVARGEGGETLMLELIDALQGGRELDTIAGLSFSRDGGRSTTTRASAAADLDELPVPDLILIVGHERLKTTPDHDELGLPVRLQLLLGDGHVRPQVPLPQPRGRGRRAQGKKPHHVFFYDDNFAADKRA